MIYFVSIILLVLFFYYQNNALEVTTCEVFAPVKRGFVMVHLSDLHGKRFGKNNNQLLRKIEAQRPDIIVFTGDLISMDGKKITQMTGFLRSLLNTAPVFYIPGNHERRSKQMEEITKRLKRIGAWVLNDEMISVKIKGGRIHVLGFNEDQGSYLAYEQIKKGIFEYKDNKEMLSRLEKQTGFKLVLCHYPENFALIGDKSYNRYDFDLMCAGHAHGGQWIFPFVGGIYAPGQGLFPTYYKGIHGKAPYLVISRGLGNSFPIRLFNRPEIVKITVLKKAEVAS